MLRNYFASSLRHLARNRLYSAISVCGLGIGLCGTLMSSLVVRDQITQGRFIPGYGRLYQVVTRARAPNQPAEFSRSSDTRIAGMLQERLAGVNGARLAFENGGLKLGNTSGEELIYWVDPQFFELFRIPVVAGDLATALQRPEGLVLDRSAARRYFGRDDPVGATLQLRSAATRELHPMTVTAVIEDLPEADTTFQAGIFASGLASFSPLTKADANPRVAVGSNSAGVRTYVRLNDGVSVETMQADLSRLANELLRPVEGSEVGMELVRVDRVNRHGGLAPEFTAKLAMIALLGLAILLVAIANFVNLMTARAEQRALEVAIRKVSGATRGMVLMQFLGDAFVYAVLGTMIAIALTEWSLPYANSFLNTGATFHYWREPLLAALLLLTPFLLTLLAGLWPALVLSSFRPGAVIGAARPHARNGNLLRQVLVVAQFGFLIALMISAGVVFRQRHFALNQALRLNTDQMLMVWAPCRDAFLSDLKAIPGVRGFACGGWQWLNEDPNRFAVRTRDGSQQNLWVVPVDLRVFDLYGLKPVAGRITLDEEGQQYPRDSAHYVINESAVRRLGFRSAREAIGQHVDIPTAMQGASTAREIIGVVPDFSLVSVEKAIKPTAYLFEPNQQYLVSVKLAANDIPGTLKAIDRAWAATGASEPTNRFFVDARLEQMYLPMLRQAQAFGVFALVTVLLATFGLFGIAATAAARRTREIGVRKALGANTTDVLKLLLWQFGKPVIWANLVAWPLAGWAMQRWLAGFAYHIDLPLWMFPLAGLVALMIAVTTVSFHALRVARARPVMALRYE